MSDLERNPIDSAHDIAEDPCRLVSSSSRTPRSTVERAATGTSACRAGCLGATPQATAAAAPRSLARCNDRVQGRRWGGHPGGALAGFNRCALFSHHVGHAIGQRPQPLRSAPASGNPRIGRPRLVPHRPSARAPSSPLGSRTRFIAWVSSRAVEEAGVRKTEVLPAWIGGQVQRSPPPRPKPI